MQLRLPRGPRNFGRPEYGRRNEHSDRSFGKGLERVRKTEEAFDRRTPAIVRFLPGIGIEGVDGAK
jgi:hypothetical protein